jgi:hypothetical protein
MINNPSIMQLVSIAGLIFIVYTIIGIIQLKTTQVWIAVAMFTMSAIFHFITALNLFGGALADKFTAILLYKIFVVLPSVGCVYYLLRSDFRSFQAKYLEIRRQESHAKWVQKNASKI